jgi:hypothetical protein
MYCFYWKYSLCFCFPFFLLDNLHKEKRRKLVSYKCSHTRSPRIYYYYFYYYRNKSENSKWIFTRYQ